jgi:hypothetical protein
MMIEAPLVTRSFLKYRLRVAALAVAPTLQPELPHSLLFKNERVTTMNGRRKRFGLLHLAKRA